MSDQNASSSVRSFNQKTHFLSSSQFLDSFNDQLFVCFYFLIKYWYCFSFSHSFKCCSFQLSQSDRKTQFLSSGSLFDFFKHQRKSHFLSFCQNFLSVFCFLIKHWQCLWFSDCLNFICVWSECSFQLTQSVRKTQFCHQVNLDFFKYQWELYFSQNVSPVSHKITTVVVFTFFKVLT